MFKGGSPGFEKRSRSKVCREPEASKTNAEQFPRQISEVLLARLLAMQYPQPQQPPCRATSTTSQSQQRRAAAGAGAEF